jgi:hypothetical protein
MTGTELRDLFLSPDFTQELTEMSSYLASITQERPIVCLIAKCLWKLGHKCGKFELEDHKVDLFLYPQRIEVKFNWNRCERLLVGELAKYGNNLQGMWDQIEAKTIPTGFKVIPGIYEDVCIKEPDIFVWIICSRDLSKVSGADLKHIVVGSEQAKYNLMHPYETDGQRLTVVDSFLEKLKAIRPFRLTKLAIPTNGVWFPSTYHFRICEFNPKEQ